MVKELSTEVLKKIIEESFEIARTMPDKNAPAQVVHQDRARNWVKTLGEQFRHFFEAYPERDDSDIRVFSKYDPTNRKDFGLNEYLFDILVCMVGKVTSANQGKELYYIREAIWQVESEFALDTRQALIDFNKLVIGNAPNKLFIGPLVSEDRVQPYLNVIKPAAQVCQGTVYTVLVPHPKDWGNKDPKPIQMWEFSDGNWLPLGSFQNT